MLKKDIAIIKKSKLFDLEYYFSVYPELQNKVIEPIKHYCEYGWKEGKNPSTRFDTNFYLSTYLDVASAGINPLVHYLKYGRKEGHKANAFDITTQNVLWCKIQKVINFGKKIQKNPYLIYKKVVNELRNQGIKSLFRKIIKTFETEVTFFNDENFLNNKKKLVINILHVNPVKSIGGVQKYILEDIIILNKNNTDVMQIFPSFDEFNNRQFNIYVNNQLFRQNIEFNLLENTLTNVCKSKDNIILSMHHCLNWKIEELEYFLQIKNEALVFFHDIFWLDYKYFDRKFAVVKALNSPENITIFFEKLIARSSCLIFPSNFLAHKYTQMILLPQEKIYIYPNQLMRKKRIDSKKIKIAYLGYKAQHKGWDLFEKLTKIKILHEHYDFFHIGAEDEYSHPLYTKIRANYNLKGKTTLDMLKKHEVDMVLLYYTMEESYSYTLYESIVAGIPVLTSTKSGNIYHMIAEGLAYGKYFQNNEDVINFMAAFENVIQWLQENPHNHSMILEHNSFTLRYINNKGQDSC